VTNSRTRELTHPPPPRHPFLQAGLSTAIRNIGWISFWSQFVLSVVSGVVLLFSTGATSGAAQVSPTDALTATGVLTGLIAAFISWGLVRTGRLIAEGKQVKLEFVMAAVLASTRLNLIGLGATILGMQASIGGLVAKTLSSAAGGMAYYNVRAPPPPVAFDVRSQVACPLPRRHALMRCASCTCFAGFHRSIWHELHVRCIAVASMPLMPLMPLMSSMSSTRPARYCSLLFTRSLNPRPLLVLQPSALRRTGSGVLAAVDTPPPHRQGGREGVIDATRRSWSCRGESF
jgi:hypothetical protein